jgi:hypothetical protein
MSLTHPTRMAISNATISTIVKKEKGIKTVCQEREIAYVKRQRKRNKDTDNHKHQN